MARTRTPPTLTEAVYRKDWAQLDLLLARGDDPNQEAPRSRTSKSKSCPLVVAVEQNNKELIQKLVKAGANPLGNRWNTTPMEQAIMDGSLDCVKLLHQLGVPLGSRNNNEPDYLADAINHRQPHITKWLMDQGLDPCKLTRKDKGWTLVNSCLSSNNYTPQHREIINLLLDAGVDPRLPSRRDNTDDLKQTYPIASAVGHGDAHIVKRFLKAGCDPTLVRDDYFNVEGNDCPLITTALFANTDERVDVLKALIEGGATIDFKVNFNPHSIGPVVSLPSLDETGMHEDRLDNMSLVALAACWSDAKSVRYLLEQGQDLSLVDRKGHNILHGLVDRYLRSSQYKDTEKLEILEALLQAGADPNHINKKGNTPLHNLLAPSSGTTQLGHPNYQMGVQMLTCMIKYGANPLLKNDKGQNCVALASKAPPELSGLLNSFAEQYTLQTTTPIRKATPRARL